MWCKTTLDPDWSWAHWSPVDLPVLQSIICSSCYYCFYVYLHHVGWFTAITVL